MTDGLAVQKLLDPDGVELEPLFELWEGMLRGALLAGRRLSSAALARARTAAVTLAVVSRGAPRLIYSAQTVL